MNIPTTYLAFHDITALRASGGTSLGRPLVLTIDGAHGSTQITLFLQPLLTADQISALAMAISDAMVMAEPAAVCPIESAAYDAAADYYRRQTSELGKLQAGEPSILDGKR
jgi:hypothetical protein